MTSVAAHTIYSRMSTIPIAPWASVAFPLYRVYRTPRPSSGNVSRLSACPTEAWSSDILTGWGLHWGDLHVYMVLPDLPRDLHLEGSITQMCRDRSLIDVIKSPKKTLGVLTEPLPDI